MIYKGHIDEEVRITGESKANKTQWRKIFYVIDEECF